MCHFCVIQVAILFKLNIFLALLQTMTECKQSLTEVIRIYFAHPILQAEGVLHVIMANIMGACVAEISSRLLDGKEMHACASIAELPTITAFLLATVCKTQALIG